MKFSNFGIGFCLYFASNMTSLRAEIYENQYPEGEYSTQSQANQNSGYQGPGKPAGLPNDEIHEFGNPGGMQSSGYRETSNPGGIQGNSYKQESRPAGEQGYGYQGLNEPAGEQGTYAAPPYHPLPYSGAGYPGGYQGKDYPKTSSTPTHQEPYTGTGHPGGYQSSEFPNP